MIRLTTSGKLEVEHVVISSARRHHAYNRLLVG